LKTEIISIDADSINLDKIGYAAEVLKSGGLVAFPTETVYGLGANALNENTVKNIFAAKGRPSDNPLIVHIADKNEVGSLVSDIPPSALRLMDEFWPGPLTIIMNKSDRIPPTITAGLGTVAVRMPSHPVALALIMKSGLPIAAPSANTSGRPSPTSAKHVIDDLSGKVDVIIDAGCTNIGLESTVLDMTANPPMILRPGGITLLQLGAILHRVELDSALIGEFLHNTAPKSPGMKYVHYSPKAEVVIIEGEISRTVETINKMVRDYSLKGTRVGILATEQTKDLYYGAEVLSSGDRCNPETIASNLFRILREFDDKHMEIILAESIDSHGIGLAVMNRLSRAAGHNIIKV